MMSSNETFIVAAVRSPIGGFLGKLSSLSAPQLGAIVMKGACERARLNPRDIDAVYFGHVLSANAGQSPVRQAALLAKLAESADCTGINKVCSSGMKAVMLGAQAIQACEYDIVMTGGMESMSQTPHYTYHRSVDKLGHASLVDGILRDGLTDGLGNFHMGVAAEACSREFQIGRQEQDEYAIRSYKRATNASDAGKFKNEILPVTILEKGQSVLVGEDEDIRKIVFDKVGKLKPAFEENGTITAANASNINDGGAAILLASQVALDKHKFVPLARIVSYADAAQAPEKFGTSPALAIPKALQKAGLKFGAIDFFEINEAYASVALANQKLLNIDSNKLNVYGGAVAMGHPLGASGARILCTLLSVLRNEGGKFGVAAICNGGGGASAMVIENLTQ